MFPVPDGMTAVSLLLDFPGRVSVCSAMVFIVAALGDTPARAQQIPVELELVLTADASSSIKGGEFDHQVGGYANVFRDDGVIGAMQDLGGNGIAVTFVQWSASFQQIVVVPRMQVRDHAEAEAFAQAIEGQARRFTTFGTATGSAMEHAAGLLDDHEDLIAYLTDNVIGGAGSFVMAVGSYADFADAIKRKLIREIKSAALAGVRRDGEDAG